MRLVVAATLALGCACTQPYRTRVLSAGTVELHAPMTIDAGTELRGAPQGTTLLLAADFHGDAAIITAGHTRLTGFVIDGNRVALEIKQGLPPYDRPFAGFTPNNGIFTRDSERVEIDGVAFRRISGFAILASHVTHFEARNLTIEDSGSHNPAGGNNATGGILIEEGSSEFRVTHSTFRNILGNALWTHSLYASSRGARGVFAENRIETVGRDAIQIGHATDMTVADNDAAHIGFPVDVSDLASRAIPVGIDTAGNVDNTRYLSNRISEINGKCMDLDGLHDSEIRGNVCVNGAPPSAYPLGNYAIVMNDTNPDMSTRNIRIVENLIVRPVFGAVFVIGERNLIAHNRFLDLNTAHCNQNLAHYQCLYALADPHILEAGVYFGRGAERPAPAKGNLVEDNVITGWNMRTGCVVSAPDIPMSWNRTRDNDCR